MLKPRKAHKQKLNILMKTLPFGAASLNEAINFSKSVTEHKRSKRLMKRFGYKRDWSRAVPMMIGIKVPLVTSNGRSLNSMNLVRNKDEVPAEFSHLWDDYLIKRNRKSV